MSVAQSLQVFFQYLVVENRSTPLPMDNGGDSGLDAFDGGASELSNLRVCISSSWLTGPHKNSTGIIFVGLVLAGLLWACMPRMGAWLCNVVLDNNLFS